MESLIILGLIGLGYMAEKKDNNINEIDDDPNINTPHGNTIYDVDNYNQSKKEEQQILDDFYDKLNDVSSNAIGINKTFEKPELKELPEDNEQFIKSQLSDNYMSAKEFLKDDRGIGTHPFFKKSPPNLKLEETFALDRTQGRLNLKKGKQGDIKPMFGPETGRENIHGTQIGGAMFEMERYISGIRKNNELPFEQEKIIPIDEKSGLNRDIKAEIASRSNIDVLRTLSNQQITYTGRVNPGKQIERRGIQSGVAKNTPYADYINTPDRYLVTGGGIYERTKRPDQILKFTNRSVFNKQRLGPSAPLPGLSEETKRSAVNRTMKQQLNMTNITERNIGMTNEKSLDYKQLGYKVYPNEREATTERTYESNLSAPIPEKTSGIKDSLRTTIKQTTLDPANNGYIVSPIDSETVGVQDRLKRTKKETDIYEHFGNARTYVNTGLSRDNYERMETDPTKEIISQGREPTISSTKLYSGMDRMNVDIKKLDDDYMTRDTTGQGKVYQKLSKDFPCKLTTMKDTLDNERIMNRIYPELLNPFRENKLTHPLTSYAY
jgi:hypothetical protein